MVVDVDVVFPFGSIAWEVVCIGCDSVIAAIRGALWLPRGASGVSERMESKEITEDISERFGETMCSSPFQETIRFAMR